MRRLPTELHAALDVALGTLLIVMPWLFGFEDDVRAGGVAVGAGATLLALSLLTRYEFGVLPVIPMSVHLAVDALVGVFLLTFALGGGLAGAGVRVWAAYLVTGVAALAGALLSDPRPSRTSALQRLAA